MLKLCVMLHCQVSLQALSNAMFFVLTCFVCYVSVIFDLIWFADCYEMCVYCWVLKRMSTPCLMKLNCKACSSCLIVSFAWCSNLNLVVYICASHVVFPRISSSCFTHIFHSTHITVAMAVERDCVVTLFGQSAEPCRSNCKQHLKLVQFAQSGYPQCVFFMIQISFYQPWLQICFT